MNTILILEDNLLDKIKLKGMLRELEYMNISTVSTIEQAQQIITTQPPLLLIVDVYLEGETGTDIIDTALANSVPILFVSASKDIAIYNGIPNKHLYGYLTKPIDPITLHATINLLTNKQTITVSEVLSSAMFIKQGKKEHKTSYSDIVWLEAEGNYTFIYSLSGKQAIKKSLRRVIEELDYRFAQCHKKYCVNLQYVTYVRRNAVRVNDREIPMTYFYKKNFLDKLHKLEEMTN
ncbi:LytR/AlgR family response regulator transcription factor [Spirosoma linguale]|uniref:Two component transcriptional regulator, LytTR family n=1 Tax=Spirosoma linguale (strain ATCC 33905 / DSM 74 / LMG 10896 / Claus 1) TaxID=504472 RepID=D2QCE5_SPILD|nr:two component transcriptional regulator, LytTR family [Spirosoma linguale DSM 74]